MFYYQEVRHKNLVRNLNRRYLAIDASNIRHGGGITHLSQLLKHADKKHIHFDRVFIWAGKNTLDQLPEKDWLVKKSHYLLNGNLLFRTCWQKFFLKRSISKNLCSALFVLGGSIYTSFKPVINFHQNLLPFELNEIKRYGFSLKKIKFFLLRFIQTYSMKRSNAIIYLSNLSKSVVENTIDRQIKNKVIYHGIEDRFFQLPKKQELIDFYTEKNPFKIIYISSVDNYKHQWNVVEAVASLKDEGYSIRLELYGAADQGPLKRLKNVIERHDKEGSYIRYSNEVNFSEIHKVYLNSNLSVFASSCETFGQIVLESMASGLPIACSNMSSMKEIVQDGCVYFNPLEVKDIKKAIKSLLDSPTNRMQVSSKAYNYAKNFSWEKTSIQTFNFLEEIYEEFN
tara:strand:- start:2030 stop:3223 length:1194 start_codon:yes stop_codon:yes gene_type:complete